MMAGTDEHLAGASGTVGIGQGLLIRGWWTNNQADFTQASIICADIIA